MVLDVGLVASALVEPIARARRDALAAVVDSTDERFGDVENPTGAPREVEVVVDVGSRERTELGRGERLQALPGVRVHVDFRAFRKGDTAAIGKNEGDRNIAAAVAAGDDLGERRGHPGFARLGK